MKKKAMAGKKLEWTALFVFAAVYIMISIFHEPWFDEAQAWQIAKCADIKDILFVIPHYEGHPPFWWLLLSIPAKLGVPFEIGLKSVGFLISVVSVFLILFRMPYPRLMRLILPFSYFILYQYGVIVRPYSLMLLAFLLLVLAFPEKDNRPWLLTGLLFFLCLTSAYGIVFAGGIAVCWVLELIKEKSFRRLFSELFRDPRTIALGCLFIAAILLVLEILPREDTFVASNNRSNSFLMCFFVALFTFIGECTLTTSSWFDLDRVLLQHVYIPGAELAAFCIVGVVLWTLLICTSSRNNLKYLIIPYVLFSTFAAAVYFIVHHVGCVLLFLLFWLGVVLQDENRFEIGMIVAAKVSTIKDKKRRLKRIVMLVSFACFLVPVYWCIHASVLEIRKEYSYGRSGYAFISSHGLDSTLIFSAWGNPVSQFIHPTGTQEVSNTSFVANPVLINAYFDQNICYNLNSGKKTEAYMHYQVADKVSDVETIAQWRNAGIPDVILGRPELDLVFPSLSYDEYALVHYLPINYIWKNSASKKEIPVYAKKDLLKTYGLSTLDDMSVIYRAEGFQITDEMREAFENGVPIEEILKPYLDAMFGEED